MPKQLFTAADIRNIALNQKCDVLVIGLDDIITPEAQDVAREMGVRLDRSSNANQTPIQKPGMQDVRIQGSLPVFPLKLIIGKGIVMDPFGEGLATPGTNVRLKDVVTSLDGSPMAAGYMALEKGEFPWKLTYDEVDIILEGQLIITRGDVSVCGNPGDIIFIPKGSDITFGTQSSVRFIYVAFPANWNDQA